MKKKFFERLLLVVFCFLLIGIPAHVNAKTVEPVRDGLAPGESRVTKIATPVEGMVNQWDITLRVEGRNIFPPPQTDVVLVIDNSNSMQQRVSRNGASRMDKAKTAATKFVNQMLQNEYNNRVGIISYGTTAKEEATLTDTNGKSKLLQTINGSRSGRGIQPNGGGTHTQEGIRKGMQLLESKGNPKARKILVLISDGVPTFSYDITSQYKNNTRNMTYNPVTRRYVTSENIPESGFLYPSRYRNNRIGSGNAMFLRYGGYYSNKYISMGNNAISEANIWENKTNSQGGKVVTDVYTVSVDMDKSEEGNTTLPLVAETGTDVLRKIASRPGLCFSVEGSKIEEALTRIGQELLSAVKDGQVVDTMGKGFELTDRADNIKVSQGTFTSDKSGTIKWDTGTLAEPVSSDPEEDIMYAEMTYRIDATEEVLKSGVISNEGFAKTNGNTTFKYVDASDNEITKNFSIPEVKPTIVFLKKELIKSDGSSVNDSQEKFALEIDTAGYGDGKYSLSPEEIKYTVHPWKDNTDYSVKEVLTSNQKYKVAININGVNYEDSKAKFKFTRDNATGFYQNQDIVIKNSQMKRLFIRQAVIDSSEEVNNKANYKLSAELNSSVTMDLTSGSTDKNDSKTVSSSLFSEYLIPDTLEKYDKLILTDILDDNLIQEGYIATYSSVDIENKHITDNSSDFVSTVNPIEIDFSKNSDIWITIFVVDVGGFIN